MKYQLVLQWPASSLDDYDALIATQNKLIESLSKNHAVDGHDMGSGEMNIFILTDSPKAAFDKVRASCSGSELMRDMRALIASSMTTSTQAFGQET